MTFIAGKLFAETGQMTALNGAAGVPAGASFINGWAIDPATGSPYVEDLASSAVPAAAVKNNGVAFNQDGRLYVTTDAVATGAPRIGGIAVREDGAMHVSTAAVNAADARLGGWAVAQTGQARMSIT